MATRKRSPDLDTLKKEFAELVYLLENDYNLKRSYIAYKIGEKASSFFKYAKGELPETNLPKIRKMIAGMRKLEKEKKSGKKLELLEKSKSNISKINPSKKLSSADDLENNYNPWLEDAEHEAVVFDSCAEPEIRVGSRVALKEIDIDDCEWGKYHYIIDSLNQPYLRRLYNNGDGTYRLVAEDDKYPDLHFEKSKILIVYRVIIVGYKPR